MGARGFDRGGMLQDCKLRCHYPHKTSGKKITGEEPVLIAA